MAAVKEMEAQQDQLETTCTVKGVSVRVWGEMPALEEITAYVQRGLDQHKSNLTRIDIRLKGEEVDLDYTLAGPGFERIRRITGYLVGTTSRFNNAKRAEEHDRVKHGVCSNEG